MSADNEHPVTTALKAQIADAVTAFDTDPNDADNLSAFVHTVADAIDETLDAIGGLLNRDTIQMAVGGATVAGAQGIVAAYTAVSTPPETP